MVPWNAARTKVQLRLSIQRLRTLQEKRLALAKKSRREIADFLVKGRVETARLRVEGLIQDDIYVELLELLELYAEKLQARFGLLEVSSTEPEASIEDAVCAIIYAAPRTELKELQVLREMMMHKFGRAFSLSLQPSTPPPSSVPARVLSKLALYTPEKQLVDMYLWEIAKGYGVDWQPNEELEPLASSKVGDEGDGSEGGDRGGDDQITVKVTTRENEESEVENALGAKADQATGSSSASGSSSGASSSDRKATLAGPAPSAKTTTSGGESNTNKKAPDYPAGQEKDAWASSAPAPAPPADIATAGKKLTEDEELALRFEKLKNLR